MLNADASVDVRDDCGNTPFSRGAPLISAKPCDEKNLCLFYDTLISAGCDLYAVDNAGRDVLVNTDVCGNNSADFCMLRALLVCRDVPLGVYKSRTVKWNDDGVSLLTRATDIDTFRSLLVAGVACTEADIKAYTDYGNGVEAFQSYLLALSLMGGQVMVWIEQYSLDRMVNLKDKELLEQEKEKLQSARVKWRRALWRWCCSRVLELSLIFAPVLPTLIIVDICIWDQVWLNQVEYHLINTIVENVRGIQSNV